MEKKYSNQPYGKGLQSLGRGYYFEIPTQRIYQESNGILKPILVKGLEKKAGKIE